MQEIKLTRQQQIRILLKPKRRKLKERQQLSAGRDARTRADLLLAGVRVARARARARGL